MSSKTFHNYCKDKRSALEKRNSIRYWMGLYLWGYIYKNSLRNAGQAYLRNVPLKKGFANNTIVFER